MHLFSATLCGQPKTDAGTLGTSKKNEQTTNAYKKRHKTY